MKGSRIHSMASAVLFALFLQGEGSSAQLRAAEASHQKEQQAVTRRLEEVFAAAESKDFARLDKYHLYGPEFTKFTTLSPERLDSEAGKRGEHDGLAALSELKMRAESLKIDVFGETAITTFILDLSCKSAGNPVHKRERATLVFVKSGGEWKIAHEHLSAITSS